VVADGSEGLSGPSDLTGLDPLLVEGMRVLRYPHTTEPDENGDTAEWHCDVVVADGVPAPGYSTYATSGVRAFPTNLTTEDGRAMRTEFVLAARTAAREAADVIDACALAAANGSFHLALGAVIPDAVRHAAPNARCEHVLLVQPFLWPELEVLRDVEPGDGDDGAAPGSAAGSDPAAGSAADPDPASEPGAFGVPAGPYVLTRLQAVPITGGELRLAAERGAEALMERLEAKRADVSNLDRPSVV